MTDKKNSIDELLETLDTSFEKFSTEKLLNKLTQKEIDNIRMRVDDSIVREVKRFARFLTQNEAAFTELFCSVDKVVKDFYIGVSDENICSDCGNELQGHEKAMNYDVCDNCLENPITA